MSTPLADVFSDKPIVRAEVKDDEVDETPAPEEKPAEPEKPETPTEPAPAPEEVDKPTENAQARDQLGKFAKTVPHEAFHAERERRKELEAKLAELQKSNKPPPSVLDDEDGAFRERLTAATRPIAQRLFNMSVAAAKRVPGREDYDDVYAFMEQEVQKQPSLMQDIDAADDPGEFIYQLGKTRKELAEVGGDITKLRESVTAKSQKALAEKDSQIKALQAEVAALKASQEKRERIPQSTNSEASAATKDDAFAGPTPLKKLFNN